MEDHLNTQTVNPYRTSASFALGSQPATGFASSVDALRTQGRPLKKGFENIFNM